MLIKQRVGKCIDCTPADGEKPLMAKRCTNDPNFHYQNFQSAKYQKKSNERKKAKTKRISDNNNGMTLAQWFNDQINQLPKCCEECDEYLNQYMRWMAHCFIAHIVAKRNFESVAVHQFNRLFLCEICHTKFDTSESHEIVKMKIWPIAVERFQQFMHLITPDEVKSLPQCFYAVYMENVSIKDTTETSTND